MSENGYVYILEVKDLTLPVCKIGFTRRYPIERCAEINKGSTGDLLWAVSSWVNVDDPERLETLIHRELAPSRQRGREFFGVDPDQAFEILKKVISDNAIEEITDDRQGEGVPSKVKRYRSKDLANAGLFDSFASFLDVKARTFGQTQRPIYGVSDGNAGVQFNLAVFSEENCIRLGVNLEGMAYGGKWPLSKLLLREYSEPTIRTLPPLDGVYLKLTRDAWQCASRPPIAEEHITTFPGVKFSDLSGELWKGLIETSLLCLDEKRKYQGRARQTVTRLSDNTRSVMDVSPHLTIWTEISGGEDGLVAGFNMLKPFYEWVRERSES
jgi:hypothetical protein